VKRVNRQNKYHNSSKKIINKGNELLLYNKGTRTDTTIKGYVEWAHYRNKGMSNPDYVKDAKKLRSVTGMAILNDTVFAAMLGILLLS
jgi:hypothetical protein